MWRIAKVDSLAAACRLLLFPREIDSTQVEDHNKTSNILERVFRNVVIFGVMKIGASGDISMRIILSPIWWRWFISIFITEWTNRCHFLDGLFRLNVNGWTSVIRLIYFSASSSNQWPTANWIEGNCVSHASSSNKYLITIVIVVLLKCQNCRTRTEQFVCLLSIRSMVRCKKKKQKQKSVDKVHRSAFRWQFTHSQRNGIVHRRALPIYYYQIIISRCEQSVTFCSWSESCTNHSQEYIKLFWIFTVTLCTRRERISADIDDGHSKRAEWHKCQVNR